MHNKLLCSDSNRKFTRADYERFLKPLKHIHPRWKGELAEHVMERFDLLLDNVKGRSLNQFIPEILALGAQIDGLCHKHGVLKDEKREPLKPCIHKDVDFMAYNIENPNPHHAKPGDDLLHRIELSQFLRSVLEADTLARDARDMHPKDKTKTRHTKK